MEQGEDVLLAHSRISPASPCLRRVMKKFDLNLTGSQVRALREKHGLSQIQFARIARQTVSVRRAGKSDQASSVQHWENDTSVISPAISELIQTKLFLLEAQLVTFDQLVDTSLVDILRDMYS